MLIFIQNNLFYANQPFGIDRRLESYLPSHPYYMDQMHISGNEPSSVILT